MAEVADILRGPRSPPCVTGATSAPDLTAAAWHAPCATGTTASPPGYNSKAPPATSPDPGPEGEARRLPRRGAVAGNVERSARGFGHRKTLSTGLGKGVFATFGGTCPDLRKDQRTPWGVRAWGDEVGDVPPP